MSNQPVTHFPIAHIDDVLPHIAGRSDFVVADKGDYKVIDYVYATADTFDHPARVECRGLKFGPDGALIARPLHKFRNIGETPELQPGLLDFTRPHTIMEKLDGSMIHPAIVGGEVVFMTRMGRTDVARKAERHLTKEVRDGCRGLLVGGATPIFEWTAPDNRIVVSYPESSLTLLAIRETDSGYYTTRPFVEAWAGHMGVCAVPVHGSAYATADGFLAYARTLLGAEGFVVRFDDGLWVKAKADDYVMKHKAKDSILQEKNVLALVLSGALDDVLPLLDEPDANAARAYRDAVEAGIAKTADFMARFTHEFANDNPKTFAVERVPTLRKELRPLAFTLRKGGEPNDVVRAHVAANLNSQTKVDETRVLHGAEWRISA